MATFSVVELKIAIQTPECIRDRIIGLQVNPLALHVSPETFNKNVINPTTLADPEVIEGELAALKI